MLSKTQQAIQRSKQASKLLVTMDSIDQSVESFLRQDGLPLPRITLGAVNRDGKVP